MTLTSAPSLLEQPLVLTLLGRALLSLLPAGRPGAHRLTELPLTLAASYLLGVVFASVLARSWLPEPLVYVALGVVLTLRLVTLPGRMIPSHELAHERVGWGGAAVWTVSAAAVLVTVAARPSPTGGLGTELATIAAGLALAAGGLRTGRRSALGRALVVLALVPAPLLHARFDAPGALPACALLVGAATFAWAHARRADPRARALALSFALGAWVLAPRSAIAVVGALLLTAWTLPVSLRSAWLKQAGILFAVLLVLAPRAFAPSGLAFTEGLGRVGTVLFGAPFHGLLAALLVVALVRHGRVRTPARTVDLNEAQALRSRAKPVPAEPREHRLLWAFVGPSLLSGLFVTGPLLALLLGLQFLPAEQPGRRV